jgi:hypothetical protein
LVKHRQNKSLSAIYPLHGERGTACKTNIQSHADGRLKALLKALVKALAKAQRKA